MGSFQVGVNVSGITHGGGAGDILPFAPASEVDADLFALASMNASMVRVFVADRFITDADAAQRLANFLQKAGSYHIKVVASMLQR